MSPKVVQSYIVTFFTTTVIFSACHLVGTGKEAHIEASFIVLCFIYIYIRKYGLEHNPL